MVQYTLDGGRSTFGPFDRLHKRFAAATTRDRKVVLVAAKNRMGSWLLAENLERPPTGDSQYFWVPGCSANGCMCARGAHRTAYRDLPRAAAAAAAAPPLRWAAIGCQNFACSQQQQQAAKYDVT